VVKKLCDPGHGNRTAPPRTVHDLAVYARSQRITVLDNLSSISEHFSDALARAATGFQAAGRALYTDGDVILLEIACAAAMNGISEHVWRADLAERTVTVELSRPKKRKFDKVVWRDFDKAQPELVPRIEEARSAVVDLNDWLIANRPSMTAEAGVGNAAFDWYLKHVKLMPYTSDEIVTLGRRELDRLWAQYALERHNNRDLPELELPASGEEHQARIDAVDARIRQFLVDEEIITIPEYIGTLATNVPWIVRDSGPNFWEQIQYRDPTPDHLHAVIPGHRFDAVVERNNPHPVRSRLTDGARVEGWGVYLEEAMMYAGLLDAEPRVRELIYLFGIFRAARMPADVWLQLNVMTAEEVADFWIRNVPYLDQDVARVDAEIYLRRPPGYGLGYTTGMLQMQALLAERQRQLGESFNLRDFHDELMAAGRLPISLLHWEMTGTYDGIRDLWSREPLPAR
jgi:hypothetical protein